MFVIKNFLQLKPLSTKNATNYILFIYIRVVTQNFVNLTLRLFKTLTDLTSLLTSSR